MFRARKLKAGDIVLVHRVNGSSIEGELVAATRSHLVLRKHRVEVDGSLIRSTADECLIPHRSVDFVERGVV